MRNLLILLLLISFAACTSKTEIAQWRGTNRDGIFDGKNLLKSWPENGPEILWSVEGVGEGYGSVTVTAGSIYLNGVIDSTSYLLALDMQGQLKWKSANGPGYVGEGFSANYPGSRSTPTVVDSLIYAVSSLGRIACYDKANGIEKWAVDMKADLNGIMDNFGYSESVLIDEEKLFCYPGGNDTNMVALDRFTGDIIWISKALGDTASQCSPIIIELPARKVLVNISTKNVFGLDAETGDLLWSHQQEKQRQNLQANTPIYVNDALYYVLGDGNGAVKLEISDDGTQITEVWKNYIGRNSMNGFLILDNKLYSCTNKNELCVLDTETGEKTDSLKIRNGAIIAADNMIYCYSDNGDLSLIDYSTTPIKITGSTKVELGTRQHYARPVIDNGVLYIRHGDALIAYGIQ